MSRMEQEEEVRRLNASVRRNPPYTVESYLKELRERRR